MDCPAESQNLGIAIEDGVNVVEEEKIDIDVPGCAIKDGVHSGIVNKREFGDLGDPIEWRGWLD